VVKESVLTVSSDIGYKEIVIQFTTSCVLSAMTNNLCCLVNTFVQCPNCKRKLCMKCFFGDRVFEQLDQMPIDMRGSWINPLEGTVHSYLCDRCDV
jgi:hypothetical protein